MGSKANDNLIVRVLSDHPFITTAAAGLAVLILTGGQLDQTNGSMWAVIAGLFILITAFAVFLKLKGGMSFKAKIFLIFAAGFALRLIYVLYTDVSTRQNDVGVFEEGVYNLFHSGYILFVRDKMTIPSIDVTTAGQFYHPPLHYVISAAFLKIYELFLGGRHNYEALQILTLCYANVSAIVTYKILKFFDLDEGVLLPSALVISFFPEFILLSGSINNDSLSVMLTFISLYAVLRWYKDSLRKDLIISAICAGLAMMAKLSAGLIAFPLAVLFLARFMGSDGKGKLKTVGNAAVYGAIAIPLGIWFQIRNFILFNVPLGYVLRSDNPYQDISRYSVFDRLFGLYPVPIEDFFMNLGSDGEQDYNTTIALIKSALFGEWNYRDSMAQALTGYFLLWVFVLLVIIVLAGFVYVLITMRKRKTAAAELSMAVLFVTELISYTMFALKYPHICSMNFRYTVPLIICGTFFAARIMSCHDRSKQVYKILSIAFALLTCAFYICLMTYVKGEVQVVDVTW